MTKTNQIDIIKTAYILFALRNEIVSALVEKLSVNEHGEIEGHDEAAEEIIVRIAGDLQP